MRLPLGQIAVSRVSASEASEEAGVRASPRPAARAATPGNGKRFGEILVARGRLDEAVLDFALRRHRELGCRLSELLVAEGYVSENDVIRALSEQTGIPYLSERRIAGMDAPTEAVKVLPVSIAERLLVLPVALRGRELVCAVQEPRDLALLDEVKFHAGVPLVSGAFATTDAIRLGIRRFYYGDEEDEGWGTATFAGNQLVTPWPVKTAAPATLPWATAQTPAAPALHYPVAGFVAAPPPFAAPIEPVIQGELLEPDAALGEVVLLDASAEIVEAVLLDEIAEIVEPAGAGAEIVQAVLLDADEETIELELLDASGA